MRLLLVEPNFPIPDKSKNHAHFLPIGLLKIATWHKGRGDTVKVVRGLREAGFRPDRVLITSLFTYWSKQVHEAAAFYHKTYPTAQIEIGGIYASLMPKDCEKRSPFAIVKRGLYAEGAAENTPVNFSLLRKKLDYQIVHTSRGCKRHCAFCGTWKIEPKFTYKNTILPEIKKPKLVFYDNNLLANPDIDTILKEIAAFRLKKGRKVTCESQSGFDLRLLTPERAKLLREARFKYPRVAWDGRYESWKFVRRAVNMLKKVGYGRKDIFVFMLFNHDIPFKEMKKKLDACRRWKVRVIDCRFRPLDSTDDNYKPGPKPQKPSEYYVNPRWTDKQVRGFRRAVRQQNIAILLDLPKGRYIPGCEQRKVS
jgi:hypothetical protein